MDLLRTAVVDITTLVATCHALKSGPAKGPQAVQRQLRDRMRRDIKRATVAYIDTLARTKRGLVDDALLAKCRVAAERQMAHALAHQALLARIMLGEPGSLDGLAAARQDLWRLAHMAIYLRIGMARWRDSSDERSAGSAAVLAGRLRRRLRKALIAYARASLRSGTPKDRRVVKARSAALAEIGRRGQAEAEGLAAIEAGTDPDDALLRRGVSKPIADLALDWQHPGSRPT